MGQVKNTDTTYIHSQCAKFTLKGAHPDWEMHPSWISGIEALNSYNFWVCEVVMPIVFQWIEEHHDEVYASVAPEHKADMGVVIAAAFALVKNLSSYQKGTAAQAAYEAALANGTWDTTLINPVWTKIVQHVRHETEAGFEKEKAFLKDTIR